MTDELDFASAGQALAQLDSLDVPAMELMYKLECSGEDFYNLLADRIGNDDAAVPVGTTCRLCEQMDCEQRVVPALQHPLRVDENVRGVSFYAPVAPLDKAQSSRSRERPRP